MDAITFNPNLNSIQSRVGADPQEPEAIVRAAKEFEAVFIAEMLKHTGLGEGRDTFGGGAGEAAFSSLLTQEWARSLSEAGGIGLTELVIRSLAQGKGHV